MMRDKVLTILLIISLGINAYLILADHSLIGQSFPRLIGSGLPPLPGIQNTSNFTDENRTDDNPSVSLNSSSEESSLPAIPTEEVTEETTIPTAEGTSEAAEEPTQSSDGWVDYTSSKYGFSFRYPQTWEINEKSTGSPRTVLILTAPVENECDRTGTRCFKYTASMTFEVDQNPFTLVPEDYFNQAVAALQNEYSITATSKSAPCIVSGTRAYQIEFYTRDERGNPDRSYMQYYTVIDGKVYIISYTGPYSTWENVYSHNKGDATRIIDTIVVKRDYMEG
jgi:hypothetical protein